MNNLQIFRTEVDNYLQSDSIPTLQKWYSLLDYLCDMKIFTAQEVKVLNQNVEKRTFPIKLPQFEEVIMKEFGDEGTKRLINDIDRIQKQIKQAKGVLAVWKQQGLSKSQIRALQILFAKGNNRMKQICHILQQKKQLLQLISQPQIQIIKSMDEWKIMQKISSKYKDYQQYQQINTKAIDNMFNQIRVREVYFRTKKSAKNGQQIHHVLGFNSKNDQQVDVVKIPKNLKNFDLIDLQLNTFNGLRDLTFSNYFVRFLGYNTTMDNQYYYYFREYVNSINLGNLIAKSSVCLEERYVIFKYWAGEIYRGLRDIFYMSTYMPLLPIKLNDIQIADFGLRVIFKNVKFVSLRQQKVNLQPELLKNLAYLIMQLLKIDQKQIVLKLQSPQNRNLVSTLLKAKEGLQKFEQKIVPCYINFLNAQTHPLFESIQENQAMQIIDNFTVLFPQAN